MSKIKENSTNSHNRRFLTECDMTYAIQLVGGRWKLIIMAGLEKRPLRYSELKKRIDHITERMLTLQLREMEEDGIVKRTVYPEVPPRVEYELTPTGRELIPVFASLTAWGTRHRKLHTGTVSTLTHADS